MLMTGGSMMYIDAICKGMDNIPTVPSDLRDEIQAQYEKEGLDNIRGQLKLLDPDFYNIVDLKNHRRVIHALEVCITTGKPYSQYRTNTIKTRPFNILKIGLERDRQELYQRIDARVDVMIEEGLLSYNFV